MAAKRRRSAKERVLARYPRAFKSVLGDGWEILMPLTGRICKKPDEAWADAAARLGSRRAK